MHKITFIMLLQLTLMTIRGLPATAAAQSLTIERTRKNVENTIHRTQAATERVNDLYCYECDTMEHGEECVHESMYRNNSNFRKKCKGEEFTCMVKRFSYTTSTENSTSSPKMWSLDRRCTVNCEAGCIVIGERTKLYACTSCCEKSMCNTGRGRGTSLFTKRLETGIGTMIFVYILMHLSQFTYQLAAFCC